MTITLLYIYMLTLQEICLSVHNGELKQTLGAMSLSSMFSRGSWAPYSEAQLIIKRKNT